MRPSTILSSIFSGLPSLRARSRAISFSFSSTSGGDVLLAEELRIGRRDVHRDIVHQFLEIVGASHEIGLAVDFHHHAELAAGVDVGADQALLGGARGLLAGRRDAALAQDDFGFGEIALGFQQGLLAFHHARAGALAELLSLVLR